MKFVVMEIAVQRIAFVAMMELVVQKEKHVVMTKKQPHILAVLWEKTVVLEIAVLWTNLFVVAMEHVAQKDRLVV